MKNKDKLYQLFAGLSDETLPVDFNEKVMKKIRKEAIWQKKKRKYIEICGYASGIVIMLFACALVFHFYDVSIELPTFELPAWSFPKPDLGLFKSQSFHFSLFIATAALFLIIIDSTIRRKIEKR